jgi:hypothetical protein
MADLIGIALAYSLAYALRLNRFEPEQIFIQSIRKRRSGKNLCKPSVLYSSLVASSSW